MRNGGQHLICLGNPPWAAKVTKASSTIDTRQCWIGAHIERDGRNIERGGKMYQTRIDTDRQVGVANQRRQVT